MDVTSILDTPYGVDGFMLTISASARYKLWLRLGVGEGPDSSDKVPSRGVDLNVESNENPPCSHVYQVKCRPYLAWSTISSMLSPLIALTPETKLPSSYFPPLQIPERMTKSSS